jgi:hypothetical protein
MMVQLKQKTGLYLIKKNIVISYRFIIALFVISSKIGT